MGTNKRLVLAAPLAALLFLLSATAVFSQEAVPASAPVEASGSPEDVKLADLWVNFLHGIKVVREDLAESYGQAILESGAEPREIYLLSVETPGSQTILERGTRLKGMEQIIARLRNMIEEGYEAERANPEQIAESIAMLPKSVRAHEIATRRLQQSGEYAMPQLIQKLMDPKTPTILREGIVTVLPRLGKEAVRPLSVALLSGDTRLQEMLANALGQIEYPHAAPRLKELAQREGLLDRTRKIATAALVACMGQEAMEKPLASLYYDQAVKYYYRAESVAPDPRYDKANVWYWREGLGLDFKPVPREIFCDIYAMRMARLALEHDADFYPAVSLWLAANLRKEADLPAGATDPTRGEDQPPARYYALAGGARYLQDVLARALNDRNSAVALGAIEALARTTGARNLVKPVAGGAQPLVEAITYPDRNVRFLAAISLADALPAEPFMGHHMVMSVLNEALRQTGRKVALIIAAATEQRNVLKDAARTAGYDVIDDADPNKALVAARASSGLDVAILTAKPDPAGVIAALRQDEHFAALPVVVAATSQNLRALAESDKRMVLIAAEAQAETVIRALAKAAELGAGEPLTAEQADAWTIRAAGSIRLLGLTGNEVYDITRTHRALATVLDSGRSEVQIAAAEALAAMRLPEAQQAIVKLACTAEADEKVRVAAFGALSESIRRFGNQLTDAQAAEIIDVVLAEKSPPVQDAASETLGAMSLPSEKIKSLILSTAGSD